MKKHLLKFLLAIFLFAGWQSSFGQVFFSESFETDGDGSRYTVTGSFTDGSGDYFIRTNGTDVNKPSGLPSYSGQNGDFYYAGEDTQDADNPNSDESYIVFDDIDISGKSNLAISGLFACGAKAKFDPDDYMHVYYDIDNSGTWTLLGAFEADITSGTNSDKFGLDSDLDGAQDGTLLTTTFQKFTFQIASTGSLMDIKVEVLMHYGDEEAAFDNIEVEEYVAKPLISNVTQSDNFVEPTETVGISADIDPNSTTVNSVKLNWGTTSGALSTSINMTENSGTWTTESDIPTQVAGTDVFYEIEVTYNTSETEKSSELNYNVATITDITNITTLRAGLTDGTMYKITGEVVMVYDTKNWRNQKYLYDGTAGIIIDDSDEKITTTYNEGDGITNIIGTLSEYNGLLQFIPETDPGAATSTGNNIVIQEPTMADFEANFEDYESELVKFKNVEVSSEPASGRFDITDQTTTLTVDDNLYSDAEKDKTIGQKLTIIGFAYQNNSNYLTPRIATDIMSANDTVGSSVYTIDQTAKTITNIPSSETLTDFENNLTPADGATFETYNADGTTVATDLASDYKVIVTAEDNITKRTYTLTVNTALSTDATITSSVYSVDGTSETITGIPYGTNLTTFEGNLTAAAGASFETYQADGTTVATDLATGYKVIVTAEDVTSTKTYTITIDDLVSDELIISEYVEGSSNNRAIEIYNPNNKPVDLSVFTVKQSHNGTGWGVDGIAYVLPLEGTLAANEVYVIANAQASAEIIAVADTTFSYSDEQAHKVTAFTGDDAIGLFRYEDLIDVIGVPDTDPGSGWDVGDTTVATVNHTLIRKYGTTVGNTDWAASAGTDNASSEWIILGEDNIDNLGSPSENTAPVISEITINPTAPTATDAVTVSATIKDDATDAASLTVELLYGSAEGSEATSVTFTQVGTTDVFEGTIPASANAVYYKVTANDGSLTAEKTGNYSITTGIEDLVFESMKLYPNPSTGLVKLELSNIENANFEVEVYNVIGKMVYQAKVTEDITELDLTEMNSGIYYVSVNDGNNRKVTKLMIQ